MSQQQLTTPTRWWNRYLWILQAILFITIVPPFLNFAALQREYEVLKPPGTFFDVGWGQKLYMHCLGSGLPTVVMEAPTGMSSDVWNPLQNRLSKLTTVCVYDRAGIGYSDAANGNYSQEMKPSLFGTPSTVERMAEDLHRLLSYSSAYPKPYILVGSELGAMVARFYSQMHETDITDIVLLEPLTENLFEQDGGIWQKFWFNNLVPSFQALYIAGTVGITRLGLILNVIHQPITGSSIPDDVVLRQKYLLCQPKNLAASFHEHLLVDKSFSQLQTLWKLKNFSPNITVTVVTGNYYDELLPSHLNKAWAKAQQQLISSLHPGSKHIVINGADRHMLYKHPNSVAEPIERLIRRRQQLKQFAHNE